jgi:hypothetical protein
VAAAEHLLAVAVAGPVGAYEVFCCGLRVISVDGSTTDLPGGEDNVAFLQAVDCGQGRGVPAGAVGRRGGVRDRRADRAAFRRPQPGSDLEIDWLTQHPVTRMLEEAGERLHPASSSRLASESAHSESGSGEHRLHGFQAWRRMDEILVADFMVFHDVIADRPYDLVIGDEAWEVERQREA